MRATVPIGDGARRRPTGAGSRTQPRAMSDANRPTGDRPTDDRPETSPSEVSAAGAERPAKPRAFRWTFPTALLAVLILVQIGHLGLIAISDHWRVFQELRTEHGILASLAQLPGASVRAVYSQGMTLLRDLSFVAFAISFAFFVRARRAAFVSFFRSMTVGVSIVGLSTLTVAVGVLVPQIGPVDDANIRVGSPEQPNSDYYQHFEEFQFAVSYFLYHLDHLYGVGMPDGEIPEVARKGLDEFGRRYGFEEASNRRKTMQAAFSGREKSDQIIAFARTNEPELRWWFDFCTRFHLNRIYRSQWFASLMTLLAIAIAFNTLHGGPKRWFTVKKFGFFTVHVGMLTMLAGGGLSRTYTVRGLLHLHEGGLDRNGDGVYDRQRDEIPPIEDAFFKSYQPGIQNLRFLPFGLSLEHFARRNWPSLRVVFFDDQGQPLAFKSRLPSYTLWEGRRFDLDLRDTEAGEQPRVRFEVLGLHDRAEPGEIELRERTAAERGDVPPRPIAVLRLPDLERLATMPSLPPREEWPEVSRFLPAVAPGAPVPSCFTGEQNAFRLIAVREGDPRARFPRDEGLLGRAFVRAIEDGAEVDEVIDVRLGRMVDLPGGYRVVFQRATKDYRVDPQSGEERPSSEPLAEQFPRNPAVFAHIVGPDGLAEDRVLVDGHDPIARGLTADYTFEDLIVSFEWDDWTSPGPPRFVLAWDADKNVLLHAAEGEPRPVPLGTALPLPGVVDYELDSVLDDFAVDSEGVRFLPPTRRSGNWDADFYAEESRGLELKVVLWPDDPSRRQERIVTMATTADNGANVWVADDRSFGIEFFENREGFPFEWRSVLRVHERGPDGSWREVDVGPEYEREIRVNDYFYYRGYRMFQTNANDQLPGYSGIGIVYDPGIPLAMAGMYIVIAGAVFAFLVRPVVLARRRRALAAPKS